MKKCSCCGVERSESDFQVRKASKDGLTASCKLCLKERDKIRDQSLERKKRKLEYQKTDAGKASAAKSTKKYQLTYPLSRAAHIIVGNAIRDGRLIKINECEICGSNKNIQAHHSDYTKPMDVNWYCQKCHHEWHKENKPYYGDGL